MPLPGKTTVRKESERGAMGVRSSASVSGCEIGPPAESEYAVDPVGVERRRPSAWSVSDDMSGHNITLTVASVKCCPSKYASTTVKCGCRPRCSVTSFMTCHPSSATRPHRSRTPPSGLSGCTARRKRLSNVTGPVRAPSNARGKASMWKGSKKPRLPIEKHSTGGHSPDEKRLETCSTVPSPPRVRTRWV